MGRDIALTGQLSEHIHTLQLARINLGAVELAEWLRGQKKVKKLMLDNMPSRKGGMKRNLEVALSGLSQQLETISRMCCVCVWLCVCVLCVVCCVVCVRRERERN